jgi:hypothetical protein
VCGEMQSENGVTDPLLAVLPPPHPCQWERRRRCPRAQSDSQPSL